MIDKPISERTFSASAWVITNRLLIRLLDLITLIFLARLLDPSDFGLVAIAMIFIVVIEAIFDLPIFQILVRETEISDEMFDTAFTLSVIRGGVITLIIASLSIPAMYYYDDKRLLPLMLFISLAPVFRGLVNPRMVIFMKALDFRQDFIMNLVSKIVALFLSCIVAILTKSYWAIAVATVVTPITMAIISYLFSPRFQKLSLSCWSMFRDTVSWFTVSKIISSINWQLDRILLGRYISSSSFGAYSLASNISYLPAQVFIQPLSQPIMAGFVKKVDDIPSLSSAYCKSLNAVFMVTAPCLLLIASLSEQAINIVFGEKWIESANILYWLSLCGFFTIFTSIFQPLFLTLNKPKYIVFALSFELAFRLPSMVFGVLYYGITGAIISHALSCTVRYIASLVLVHRHIGVSPFNQLISFWRPLISLLPMYLLLSYFQNSFYDNIVDVQYIFMFILAITSSLITYFITIFLLWNLSNRPNSIESILFNKVKIFLKVS